MLSADDEPALIGERKRSEHDCVGKREQHGSGADAKGEQEYGDTRELGALQERAACRSQLAHSLTLLDFRTFTTTNPSARRLV